MIDLNESSEELARAKWPQLVEIAENYVQPGRDRLLVKGGWSAEIGKKWWLLAQRAEKLERLKKDLSYVIVTASSAVMHHMFAYVSSNSVFSHKLIVVASDDVAQLGVLQSRVHELWSRTFGTTFGSSDALTYSVKRVYATFPFPDMGGLQSGNECQNYLEGRAKYLTETGHGLTKAYGRFHDQSDAKSDIECLRGLHGTLDRAVLEAYGWGDLAEQAAPVFLTDENEDDHSLQGRLFWPSDFRDEVLARLLALNAERAEAERAAGLTTAIEEDDEEDFDDEEEAS